jgi:carbon-monoxide dehydrogenase medium subunit
VKPGAFTYVAAETLEAALAAKAQYGDDARFLAGGQSLIPAMNFRLASPAVLIDINPLDALAYVRGDGDGLAIGALTRNRAIERDALVQRHQPLVAEAMPHVSHPQIRNRGTFGGNLAQADPASEMPAVVLALGGRLKARSAKGERWIAAHDFFLGALTTALRADEMLVEIALPALPPRTGTCFMEVARRQGDYAMMGVAAIVGLDAAGVCRHAALAYCNAGDRPIRADQAAQALIGQAVGDAQIRDAAAAAQGAIAPTGNVHAGADYQRHLGGVLTRRALGAALERAKAA